MFDITEECERKQRKIGYIDEATVGRSRKKDEEKIVLFVCIEKARIKQILRDVVCKLIIIIVLYAANIGKQII